MTSRAHLLDDLSTQGSLSSSSTRKPPRIPRISAAALDPWLRVVGTFLVYMASWGFLNAYGAFYPYYQSTLLPGYTPAQLAWPGTLQAVLIIAVGVLTGPLFDRGYINSLLLVGGTLIVAGIMLLSLCTQYYQVMLAQGLAIGLGSGIVYIPSLAMVSVSFDVRARPLAIALTTTGSSAGGVVYPIALERLIYTIGDPWATRVLGFISLFVLVVGITLVITRSGGLLEPKPPRAFIDYDAFSDLPFMLFCMALFLMFIAYFIPFFYIPTFATTIGSSPRSSIYLLVTLNAATFPGRVLSAYSMQRYGAGATLLACATAAGGLLLAWIGVTTPAGCYVWSAAFGLTAGPLVSVPSVLLPHLSPRLGVVGTRMGMSWLCSAFGVLVGAPVAGALVRIEGGFLGAQVFAGATMLAAAGLLIVPWLHASRVQAERAGKA